MTDVRPTVDCALSDLPFVHPGARHILHRWHLDYACNGGKSLAMACAERHIDARLILKAITDLPVPDQVRDVRTMPLPALVDHIQSRYHDWLWDHLPQILEQGRTAQRTTGVKNAELAAACAVTDRLFSVIQHHMLAEERQLFPWVRGGCQGNLVSQWRLMDQDHREHVEGMATLRSLTDNLSSPPEACAEWRDFYVALDGLEGELMAHVHLETWVLFPRCRDAAGV